MFDVSIILPVFNAESWLDECLQSIFAQSHQSPIELCIYNDCSTDNSLRIINEWTKRLTDRIIHVTLINGLKGPLGCGYAKNRAVQSSSGEFLCFVDADDVLSVDRVEKQLSEAQLLPHNTIIGCKVQRLPEDSTIRYTKWINRLSSDQLYTQRYTSHGPTVVMPTWFMHRCVFDAVGGFSEEGKGVPEDYIFFLRHLDLGGKLHRLEDVLLTYRHHPNATSMSVHKDTIWRIRLAALENNVLSKWDKFTIWNAGKQGRRFFRDLTSANQSKVVAFCDVDVKKINKGVYIYEECEAVLKPRIPIIHYTKAKPPFIICVKLDLTNGQFEKNLAEVNLIEGKEYHHFN